MTLSTQEHHYLSTACLHQLHTYCDAPTVPREGEYQLAAPSYSAGPGDPKNPARCKFCGAKCICPCHHDEPIPTLNQVWAITEEPLAERD